MHDPVGGEETRQLADELRKRDELLIRLSRQATMGEMLNSIAHQWRQPLNTIGLIVQSLQLAYNKGTLTAEAMQTGTANTMRMLRQISVTLDDFREYMGQERKRQRFSIRETVRRACDFVLPALKKEGFAIQHEETEEVSAEGFPAEYFQALLGLISVARHLLREGQVSDPLITIRAFHDQGRSIVSIIINGGVGPEESLDLLFDPGFATRQQDSWTGLFIPGLIMEMMQGRVTASRAGQGAEFRIEL